MGWMGALEGSSGSCRDIALWGERMRLLLSLLLLAPIAHAGEVPVAFVQEDARAPIIVKASGTVSPEDGGLLVQLRDVQVADDPADPNVIPYASYRVCLARSADAGWESASCSSPVKINVMMGSDESVSLPGRKLTVPTEGVASLDGLWLVLEMTSRPVGGKTRSVYSRSQPLGAGVADAR